MDGLENTLRNVKREARHLQKALKLGTRIFEWGFLLRQTREELGMTQEEVAKKLRTKKSAISRIENHAEDIRLSTLNRYAEALGKKLHVVMQ